MSKKGTFICILVVAVSLTIVFGIDAIQSRDPILFVIELIVSSVFAFIYHYVTKDVIDSKFVTKNT